MYNRHVMKEIKRGMKNGIPIALGYLSVSFSFGAIAVSMGFSVIQAILISLLNLTSAGQFASLGIIAGQGTYLEMAIVELTVNVTADGDGALDGLDVGLVDEDFPCLRFV